MNKLFLPLAAVAAATIVGLSGASASAHSVLVASSPGDGETVTALPAQFSVTANEPLLDLTGDASGFAIQVVDAAGRFYGDGCLTISESTLAMGATLGEPGDYRLYWQVVSADAHPISGELAFTWAPDDGSIAMAGLATPPVCGQTAETPTPSATASPTVSVAPEPTTTPTAAPVTTAPATFWSNPVFIGGSLLAVLALVAAVILGIRALRGRDTSS